MWTAVTSNMTPCSLVGVYPRFRGPWFPHNQGNIRVDYSSDIWYWRQQEPLKRPYISIKLHGVISQNIVIFIATEVKLKYRFEGAIILNLASMKKMETKRYSSYHSMKRSGQSQYLSVFTPEKRAPYWTGGCVGPQNQFRRFGKDKYLPAIQLVHDIFCFSTNCNWGMKFGPSATQAARRIYRSDSKEVNGELRKLRSEELHDCAPKEFN